jgi:hypothetical protein
VTTIFLGPVAGALAAGVFLLTTDIPGVGTSVIGLAAKGIAEGIGKAAGWSDATIQAVTGALNLAFAVILAVAGGFAAAGGTAAVAAETAAQVGEGAATAGAEIGGEALSEGASTVTNVVEDGTGTAEKAAETASKLAKYSSNAGKVIGIGAFASQVSNSNCFYDIIYGSWVSANPKDKDKAAEYAGYISAAINIIIGVIAMFAGGNAIANSIEDASTFSSIAQKLGSSSTTLLSIINRATQAAQLVNGGMDGYSAYTSVELAGLKAAMTEIMGFLTQILGNNSLVSKNSKQINDNLKANLNSIETLLQGIPDFGSPGKAETQAMIKINQHA